MEAGGHRLAAHDFGFQILLRRSGDPEAADQLGAWFGFVVGFREADEEGEASDPSAAVAVDIFAGEALGAGDWGYECDLSAALALRRQGSWGERQPR